MSTHQPHQSRVGPESSSQAQKCQRCNFHHFPIFMSILSSFSTRENFREMFVPQSRRPSPLTPLLDPEVKSFWSV